MGYVYNETMKFPVFSVCIPTPMVLSIFNSSIFNKEDNLKLEDAIKVVSTLLFLILFGVLEGFN